MVPRQGHPLEQFCIAEGREWSSDFLMIIMLNTQILTRSLKTSMRRWTANKMQKLQKLKQNKTTVQQGISLLVVLVEVIIQAVFIRP